MLSRSDLQKIDEVRVDGELCAMILPACYDKPGIQFFTRGELSQQLASMSYPAARGILHSGRLCSSERAASGSISSQNGRNIEQAVC
jgi:hypothetical protein